MGRMLTREELLTNISEMMDQALEDWRSFTDPESRRKYMNSYVSASTQYHTIQSREELINLKEVLEELKAWRDNR